MNKSDLIKNHREAIREIIEGYSSTPADMDKYLNDLCEPEQPEVVVTGFRNVKTGKHIEDYTPSSICLESMLHNSICVDSGHFEIFSLRVGGVEYQLGDAVKDNISDKPLVIKSLYYTKNMNKYSYRARFENNADWPVTSLTGKAPKREVIFVTEDGFEALEPISVWAVTESMTRYYGLRKAPSPKGTKYFVSESAALSYIDLNKPVFSKQMILDALDDETGSRIYKEEFKSKLGI